MSEQNPTPSTGTTGPAPDINNLGDAAERQRAYEQHGSLWQGQSRSWFAPAVQLIAQHAGILGELDRLRTVDRQIRMADVQRYLEATGRDLPEPPPLLPNLSPDQAQGYVDMLLTHGLWLIALTAEGKEPVHHGWNTRPALTREEAIAHLVSGGNLGIDVGRSGVIVVDCEDIRSTSAMLAAGYTAAVATASGQDKTSAKFGGAHFYFRRPEGVTDEQLRSVTQLDLGGGKVDLLAAPADPTANATRHTVAGGTAVVTVSGARYVVAPGSQLFLARSGRYAPMQRGVFDGGQWLDAPEWMWDASKAPEAVAEIGGGMTPRVRRPYVPNPHSDQITQQVDGIDWDEWLAYANGKLTFFAYDSDGCGVYTYVESTSSPRSVILHEGCGNGHGAHAFSGTLAAAWGREHGSRLQFTAFLADMSERELAREFDIDLRRNPLSGYTLSDLGVTNTAPGETDSEKGAAAKAEAQEAAEGSGAWLQREIARIEEETAVWEKVKFLRDVDDAAASHGVLNWGLLCALLPRVACWIPPHVRLVGSSGQEGGANSGAAVSIFGLALGAPEAGKSEVLKIAADLVPLPPRASIAASGTGEGVMKTFGEMLPLRGGPTEESDDSDAEDELERFAQNTEGFAWKWHTDTVLLETAEAEVFMTEMDRTGTKAMALYRGMWMGEVVGTTTSDIKRRTFMSPHTYRFCCALGAQLDLAALGPLLEGGRLGNPQRFLPLPVGVTVAQGSPRVSIQIPDVNYDGANAPALHTVTLMEGQHRPVWIHWPEDARAEFVAARANRTSNTFAAFDVERVLLRAEIDDPLEDMKGHELLHQLKVAAVLARAEGLIDPTNEHWAAAGAIMQVRAAVLRATVNVLEACKKVDRIKTGRNRGEESGHSKLVETSTQDEYRRGVAAKAAKKIQGSDKPLSEKQIGRGMTKTQQGVLPDVLRWMVQAGTLREAGENREGNTLYALPVNPTAAPPMGVVPDIGTIGKSAA